MNQCTLESFISFCDDMMICEEGFSVADKGFNVLDTLMTVTINVLKKLLNRITECLLNCTKNKQVDISFDFHNLYRNIQFSINHTYEILDSSFKNENIDAYQIRKNLIDIQMNMSNLIEISETYSIFSSSHEVINTDEIYNKMVVCKRRIENEIQWWIHYHRNINVSEKETNNETYHRLILEILHCEVKFCEMIYSKI